MPNSANRLIRLLPIIITPKLIFQAAGLSATPTIAAAPTNQTAEKTLTGKTDTQSAMAKDLQFHVSFSLNGSNIRQTDLSGQNYPGKTGLLRPAYSGGIMQRHLRAGVQRNLRIMPAQQISKTPILHNQSVSAHIMQLLGQFQRVRHFIITYQRIHSQIDRHATQMRPAQQSGQFFQPKIIRKGARTKTFGRQINRVRPTVHRRQKSLPAASWSQNFHIF